MVKKHSSVLESTVVIVMKKKIKSGEKRPSKGVKRTSNVIARINKRLLKSYVVELYA